MLMTNQEAQKAMEKAGYREKYAMKNGRPYRRQQNGETLYTFFYSKAAAYQDANGATWNATREAWTN